MFSSAAGLSGTRNCIPAVMPAGTITLTSAPVWGFLTLILLPGPAPAGRRHVPATYSSRHSRPVTKEWRYRSWKVSACSLIKLVERRPPPHFPSPPQIVISLIQVEHLSLRRSRRQRAVSLLSSPPRTTPRTRPSGGARPAAPAAARGRRRRPSPRARAPPRRRTPRRRRRR